MQSSWDSNWCLCGRSALSQLLLAPGVLVVQLWNPLPPRQLLPAVVSSNTASVLNPASTVLGVTVFNMRQPWQGAPEVLYCKGQVLKNLENNPPLATKETHWTGTSVPSQVSAPVLLENGPQRQLPQQQRLSLTAPAAQRAQTYDQIWLLTSPQSLLLRESLCASGQPASRPVVVTEGRGPSLLAFLHAFDPRRRTQRCNHHVRTREGVREKGVPPQRHHA